MLATVHGSVVLHKPVLANRSNPSGVSVTLQRVTASPGCTVDINSWSASTGPRRCRGLGHASTDQVRGALGDHDGWGVGVAAGDDRHDRRVHHAQALESVHAKSGVDHRIIARLAHPARAD